MDLERERKDMREMNYPAAGSSDYEEEDQYRSREVINLGDLMSAKRAQQRAQNADSFEREGVEASP